jgi:hypothetical protein
MVVRLIWYEALFSKTWLRVIDTSAEELEPNPGIYLVTTVAALISAYALAVIVGAMGAGTLVTGALVGAFVWIGLGATATLVYTLFEGPPTSVWALHGGYMLLVFLIQGGLFAVWV